MMDRILKSHLDPIARNHRRWQLFRALTSCWLTAAAVGIILILIRVLTGWSSPWTFLLLLAGTIVWACISWWRNRQSKFDYAALARKIETEHPELHALLLTAIEQTPDPSTGELNYLQERVLKEALANEESQQWSSLTLRRLDLMQISNGLTLLFFVAVMLGVYLSAPRGGFFGGLMAHGVTVTPGDTSVEKGNSLVVLARFDGSVPAEASLVVRPANEPERRIPLVKNLDDPVFGTSVPEVKGELTYRIEYDGEATRDFRVTTFEFPRLERADARITYPEYTGLSEKTIEDTRRISAVEGSTLDYTFHLNKPVASATLVTKPTPNPSREGNSTNGRPTLLPSLEGSGVGLSQVTLNADTNRPNVFISTFKLETSQRYELLLVDDAGRTNKLPPQFVLDVLTNRVPELKFAFPRGDQQVSPLEEIAFRAEASDDFGLKAYGIAYNLAGDETKFVELGENAGANEKRPLNYLLALENLAARQDEALSYFLWADDTGPDGNLRRTTGDMYFAEVRPFEEIFHEGQSSGGGGGQQRPNLIELQKQIINATWNLQRRESRKTPSTAYKKDATTVRESQTNVLEQVRSLEEQNDDPRSTALIDAVEEEMEKAAKQLATAVDDNSLKPLPDALSAEQSAYQALLRLEAHEFQVVRGQNGQGQGSRDQRLQRNLDQLELKQSDNRYETQREAAPPQDPKQREQLQVFNRLKELAQRQQDVNERLKELQAALKEAKTQAEREDIQRRLKRLQEEQQQLLADVDEVRQRMERPENQSEMSEARERLEQTRDEVQRASESLEQGEVSQALSSGTRAQRDLQQLRDDFRKQSSNQFAEDMRELRQQARELAEKQEDIGQKINSLNQPTPRKSLTDSEERNEVAAQLEKQKEREEDLVKHATDITQRAESSEPLLSRQLYDTLRKAAQNDAQDLEDTSNDLLARGRLYRSVHDRLSKGKEDSKKAVEVAAQLLRDGFSSEANNLEQRARQSINELKAGVEHAAESVLGDDTEALRFARQELNDLSQQLENEIAQSHRQANTNTARSTSAPAPAAEQKASSPTELTQAGGGRQQGQDQGVEALSEQGVGQQQASNARQGRGGTGDNEPQTGQQAGGQAGGNGQGNFLDQFGGSAGGGVWGGPITGPEYTQWSDRLRDVEESLDVPELRNQAARIRDRARSARLDLKRHSIEPKWDMVNMDIYGPLVELRNRVSEELARRESKEALVPIDRDPVPSRYSELVRRYYEELGKSETSKAVNAGGLQSQ